MRLVPSAVAGAVLAAGLVACTTTTPPRLTSLPFIENDFTAALTRARQENRPLFVEVWAPW